MAIWILIGAGVGWVSFSMLGMNERRGLTMALVIGAAGGLVGGKMVAPLLAAAPPAEAGMMPLFIAAAAALVCLALGNHVEKRWDV